MSTEAVLPPVNWGVYARDSQGCREEHWGRMRVVLGVTLALILAGCSNPFEKYAAEVGYYQGSDTKWEIWGEMSLDDCKTAAMTRYNHYYSERRAVSWACLKLGSDGSYLSRHR